MWQIGKAGRDSAGPQSARNRVIVLALLSALFGALHHLDHIARANHVGWPLMNQVTPFTLSLLIYPLLLGGAWATARRDVTPWYWVAVSLAVAGLVTWVHGAPDPRGEQIKDLYLPYAEPPAYCTHQSAADPPVAPSALCDPTSTARPLLGVLAVANMLVLAATLWLLVATAVLELVRALRVKDAGPPAEERAR